MAKNLFGPYRGYCGTAEFDLEGQVLFGKILSINDRILYEARTPEALEKAFKDAVDDYLALCAELGESPDRPYSGSVTIRFGEELHKRASIAACVQDVSMNEYVIQAVREKIAAEHSIVDIKRAVKSVLHEHVTQWERIDFERNLQVQADDDHSHWQEANLLYGSGVTQ